jgi:D-lactate dehydrogenase
MRVAAFSVKPYDTSSLAAASAGLPIEWAWFEPRLDRYTARLAEGAVAINCFVNDQLDAATLDILAAQGV